jgi:hypothetical protein
MLFHHRIFLVGNQFFHHSQCFPDLVRPAKHITTIAPRLARYRLVPWRFLALIYQSARRVEKLPRVVSYSGQSFHAIEPI